MQTLTREITAFTEYSRDAKVVALTYNKVTRRLIPILFICYVSNYLDRINVGIAKLQMQSDLHFSETAFGIGMGIFFLGYILFEVPGNLILHRVGARLWIARIMISWSIISGLMYTVKSPNAFYLLRFLLGVAEAGFYPGIILYLTYWFPSAYRCKVFALFLMALPLSPMIGNPLSGWIMQALAGAYGLKGWQWLFLLEAIPSLVLGIIVLFYLDNKIDDAKWLSTDEKLLLKNNLRIEAHSHNVHSFKSIFKKPLVWISCAIQFCLMAGLYTLSFWQPTLLKASGLNSPLKIGLVGAIPNAVAIVAMIIITAHSDKKGERMWHLFFTTLTAATGIILFTLFSNNISLVIISMTIASIGIYSAIPVFWSLPTRILVSSAAAGGIAFINSMGNISGFTTNYLIGWIKDLTHSTNMSMYLVACFLLIAGLLGFRFRERKQSKTA